MERPKPPTSRRPTDDRKKVVVVSSEPGPEYDLLREKLEKYTWALDDPIILVRSALGANKLVIRWAEWRWYGVQIWHSDEFWSPAERNAAMVRAADYLVAFIPNNGTCKSTENMIRLAVKQRLQVRKVLC